MAVGLKPPGLLHPVAGVRLAASHCGIKSDPSVKDLALVEIAPGACVAGVFTQSHFSAAPVNVCRRHLAANSASRYLLINSGNANAGTGEAGLRAALECCAMVAKATGVASETVLPFSTGVIAEALPLEPIGKALPGLIEALDADAWLAAAEGIMTTDTLPKAVSTRVDTPRGQVTITGIAKGSGMIKPNMATLLVFFATDARIAGTNLSKWLQRAVGASFNSITVDGDTSTNDSCVLIATGASGVEVDDDDAAFGDALDAMFQQLARAIIRDAEGATKFVEIRVEGAASEADARSVAFTIAESPLVKTAIFAADPNWGRLIMAIGRAPLERIDIHRVDLFLGETRLLHGGLPDSQYRESRGQAEMDREEITIRVNLNIGSAEARVWTSDLSYEYVKINAEYRS